MTLFVHLLHIFFLLNHHSFILFHIYKAKLLSTESRVFINILWTVILKKKTYLNHVVLGHNLTKELITLIIKLFHINTREMYS